MTDYPPPPQGGPGEGPDTTKRFPPGSDPAGNYPPPQSGGYPPPPAGGYPPPPGGFGPPPGGGYQQPPGNYGQPNYAADPYPAGGAGYGGGVPQLNVGDALTYGWNKFKANAGVWIGISVIAFVISLVIQLPTGGLAGFGIGPETSVALSLFGSLLSWIVGMILQAAFVNGALREVDGNKPAIGDFFQFRNLGAVLIAAILVGIVTTIGFILLVIPGIIATFLLYYTLQFVIDRDQEPVAALKSSFELTSKNVGPLLLLALALVAINFVGALLCGLGLLVTIPVTSIASTYAYRFLTQGPISPAV